MPKPGEKPEVKKEISPKPKEPSFQMSLLDLDEKPTPTIQPQPQTTNLDWNVPFVAATAPVSNIQLNQQNWNWTNVTIAAPAIPQTNIVVSPHISAPKPTVLNQNNQFNLTGLNFESNLTQSYPASNSNPPVNLVTQQKPPASNNLIDQFDDFQSSNPSPNIIPQTIETPQKQQDINV